MVFVQLFEALLEVVMYVLRVLGLDLKDDREPRLAVDQRRQPSRAGGTQHRIALKVAQPQPLFDHLGTVRDAGRGAGFQRFSAARPFAATPQMRSPMLAVGILLDPV